MPIGLHFGIIVSDSPGTAGKRYLYTYSRSSMKHNRFAPRINLVMAIILYFPPDISHLIPKKRPPKLKSIPSRMFMHYILCTIILKIINNFSTWWSIMLFQHKQSKALFRPGIASCSSYMQSCVNRSHSISCFDIRPMKNHPLIPPFSSDSRA